MLCRYSRARSIKSPGCQWLQIPSFGDQKYDMAFYFGTGIVHTMKLPCYLNWNLAFILATELSYTTKLNKENKKYIY